MYVYVGSSDTAILGAMTSHNPLPLQLSTSWVWTPADPNTDDPYFERMAAQGQSFFKGAGDLGSWQQYYECWPCDSALCDHRRWYGLDHQGPGKRLGFGNGWCQQIGNGAAVVATLRTSFAIPEWQKLKGVITKANEGSTKYRNGPDVSANANFTLLRLRGPERLALRTNMVESALPRPCGPATLPWPMNRRPQAKANPSGSLILAIYPLGLGKTYDTLFHDITKGNNGYPATKGYDLASGWGSPNTDGLINALTK